MAHSHGPDAWRASENADPPLGFLRSLIGGHTYSNLFLSALKTVSGMLRNEQERVGGDRDIAMVGKSELSVLLFVRGTHFILFYF